MPRRNRGRNRRVFDMGAVAEAVWDVSIPQPIMQGMRDYMLGDHPHFQTFTSDSSQSVETDEDGGSTVRIGGQSFRVSTGAHSGHASTGVTFTGDPSLGEAIRTQRIEPLQFQIREEDFRLDSIANPDGQYAKHGFVSKKGEGYELATMIAIPCAQKPTEETLRYLDRTIAAILNALTQPTPAVRLRRSIIIEKEETDGESAEPQPEARKEG